MTSANNDNRQQAARCPICKRRVEAEYEPFCSKRCADIDLHRWLSGAYAIPAEEDDSDGVVPETDEPS